MTFSLLKPRFLVGALLGGVILSVAGQASPAPAAAAQAAPALGKVVVAPKPAPGSLVDVNLASKRELKKLPGVNDAVAEQIIAGRPYLSKAKLVSKKVIPLALFQVIRNQIVVYAKLPAKK